MNPVTTLFVLLVLSEICFFVHLYHITGYKKKWERRALWIGSAMYWALFVFSFVGAWGESDTYLWRRLLKNTVFIIGIAKTAFSAFLLLDTCLNVVRRVLQSSYRQLRKRNLHLPARPFISRGSFLQKTGIVAGGVMMGLLFWGFRNKYNYKLYAGSISIPSLPNAFRGFRIAQISDIHAGSFTDHEAVARGVDMLLAEKPDIIVFTGDLVNYRTPEIMPYESIFARLRAPYGVYSILGNHDYGDYVKWDSPAQKAENLVQMKAAHKRLGWRLLCNEHVYIRKDGERIALIGVENWSATRRFSRHGDIEKAYAGLSERDFKLLLSHDPSHWDKQIFRHYPDIALTLSGHTHGMQFGVEIPFFKWSPVQYLYPRWAGLYREEGQLLYVNRGYGFIGYQGRVGIMPEITILQLV